MVGHATPLAEQVPARRSAHLRYLAVAAAALGMGSPASAFAPSSGSCICGVAGQRVSAVPARCRVSAPLSLRMAEAPDRRRHSRSPPRSGRCAPAPPPALAFSPPRAVRADEATWVGSLMSKVRHGVTAAFQKLHRKVRRDALDQSWSGQAIERTPSAEAAQHQATASAESSNFATQMLLINQLQTKRILLDYQIHEMLENQPSSFLSLYSDVCSDTEASLPFAMGPGSLENLAKAASETETASDAESDAPLPQRRTGSGGVRFLQAHLHGVPDLQEPVAPPTSTPEAKPATLVLTNPSATVVEDALLTQKLVLTNLPGAMEDALNEVEQSAEVGKLG